MKSRELLTKASEKINYGEDLLQQVCKISNKNIEGLQKLSKKIKQELNFLKRICQSESLKEEHLQCSNLTHFGALIKVLEQLNDDCVSVKKPFNLCDRKIVVDIVCNSGLKWIKVIARNPKSLSEICQGNGNYGVRTIFNQAEEYTECAQLHPCLFQTPKITFVFANGVGTNLAHILESKGLIIEGQRIDNLEYDNQLEFNETLDQTTSLTMENTRNIININLDVSTMLAYTSSVTNGSCLKYNFTNHVLKQQAEWESKRPVKPLLDQFFENKKLYCCETAKSSFLNILKTIGGTQEIVRGHELLARLTVLPDHASVDDIGLGKDLNYAFDSVQYNLDNHLQLGGKIKERSLIIFAFGDRIKAVTVTSNDGFVRAARQQGIHFVVFVHESRALTEQKELKSALII